MFNEAEVLSSLFSRLETVLSTLNLKTEVTLVDDGSTDTTWLDINSYKPGNFDLQCINLSRNFGKEAALTAGLQIVSGSAVIILDADCQDPPELIPCMVDVWQKGADIVNMKRRSRQGETWFKRKSAALYYKLLNTLSDSPIPENVGDFRLLSRPVIDEVNRLQERNRYMKGLLSWPGFNPVTLEYDREPRAEGTSKWNYWQLSYLALSGITAFSNKPLRLASLMGCIVSLSALIYAAWFFVETLIFGNAVSGYPSIIIIMLFIGGVELLSIGILGEYIGRIFTEVKDRPSYIIREDKLIPGVASAEKLHLIKD